MKKHRGKWQFKNSVVSRRRRRWAEGHLLLINLRKKIQKLEFLNPKTKKKNLQELNVRRSHFFSWLNFAPFFLLKTAQSNHELAKLYWRSVVEHQNGDARGHLWTRRKYLGYFERFPGENLIQVNNYEIVCKLFSYQP